MRAITDAKFTKRKEAEDFLAKYEQVHPPNHLETNIRIKVFDNFS